MNSLLLYILSKGGDILCVNVWTGVSSLDHTAVYCAYLFALDTNNLWGSVALYSKHPQGMQSVLLWH